MYVSRNFIGRCVFSAILSTGLGVGAIVLAVVLGISIFYISKLKKNIEMLEIQAIQERGKNFYV